MAESGSKSGPFPLWQIPDSLENQQRLKRKQTMSEDMLNSITRALVGVPTKHYPLVLDVVNKLGSEDADAVHQVVAAALRKKSALVVEKSTRLILLNSVALPATIEKETSECLVGDIYGYRDADIDDWLPKMQPASEAGTAVVYDLGEDFTFAKMFRVALKLADDAPLDVIERLLKERKHVLTLQQLADMIERQEQFVTSLNNHKLGENVGLRTDGLANFVPVLDKDGKVCVMRVPRDGKWERYVRRLGNDYVWIRGRRLVLRISDASKL